MLGRVVFGLRTWMCTIAAPALAASMEDLAICSGVTGTAGLRPGVSAEPVTAHEIMTLRCMSASLATDVEAKPTARVGLKPRGSLAQESQSKRAIVFAPVSRVTSRGHAIERWGQVHAELKFPHARASRRS